MSLIAYRGDSKTVNFALVHSAFDQTPSLIVDCANCADPHSLFPYIRQEQLHDVYVINAEAIYRFRDTIIRLPHWIRMLGIRKIIITTIDTLFSYDDDEENRAVLMHCWELLKKLGAKTKVMVAVKKDSVHEAMARTYADAIQAMQ
jgi:hypothetical protein